MESVTRCFTSGFFHESSSPKLMKITSRPLQIFSKIHRDIRKSRCTTEINDTSGKFRHQYRLCCEDQKTTSPYDFCDFCDALALSRMSFLHKCLHAILQFIIKAMCKKMYREIFATICMSLIIICPIMHKSYVNFHKIFANNLTL